MKLDAYLNQLETCAELKRIKAEVDPDLELAAICRREFAHDGGGSALYFSHVSGSPFPVVANLFGSKERTARQLGSRSFTEFSEKIATWLGCRTGSATERLISSSSAVLCREQLHEEYESTQLLDLPAIKSWPGEGGRYLNLALALTLHPETGERNLGLYRAQVLDNNNLALNFSPSSGAGRHFEFARQRGTSLPVCLLLGVDTPLIWTAAAPLPESCDELEFYQSLFDEEINLINAETQPLQFPENTGVVIEGELLPEQTVVEGPYGNHTGHYVTRDDCPLLKVTSVRYRQNAVVPTTVVGPPPSENIHLGMANEVLIREMIKIDYPEIHDLWMPPLTIFHGAVVLAVKCRSHAENKELIYALWEEGPLSRSRFIVLVDEDVHARELATSWWQLVNGLSQPRIYSQSGKTAIDATGIIGSPCLSEDPTTLELLKQHKGDYQSW